MAVFLQVMWAHHDAPSMPVRGTNPRVRRAAESGEFASYVEQLNLYDACMLCALSSYCTAPMR
jgi:hypothetical protein